MPAPGQWIPTAVLAALLLLGPAPAAPAEEDSRTLEGIYGSRWGAGPVTATFVPSGDRLWEVRFDFIFNDRERTYHGTAEGSFAEGAVSGRVKNEYGRRTFTFSLQEQEEGVYKGKHAEVKRGREKPTGTIDLELRNPSGQS